MADLSFFNWCASFEKLPASIDKAYASTMQKLEILRDEFRSIESRLFGGLRALSDRLDGFEARLSEMTAFSNAHYLKQVSDPIARRVIGFLDAVERLKNENPVMNGLADQLGELLLHLGVEPIVAGRGELFDPKRMKPIELITTSRPDEGGRISHILQAGYERREHVLRPLGVGVFRHTPTSLRQAG